jgi:hypothetical protein
MSVAADQKWNSVYPYCDLIGIFHESLDNQMAGRAIS